MPIDDIIQRLPEFLQMKAIVFTVVIWTMWTKRLKTYSTFYCRIQQAMYWFPRKIRPHWFRLPIIARGLCGYMIWAGKKESQRHEGHHFNASRSDIIWPVSNSIGQFIGHGWHAFFSPPSHYLTWRYTKLLHLRLVLLRVESATLVED